MTLHPGFVDGAAAQPARVPLPEHVEEHVTQRLPPGFVEAEYAVQQGRIEIRWNPDVIETRRAGFGSAFMLTSGIALLVIGWVCISAIGFVVDQFGRSALFGAAALVVFGTALGVIAYAVWIEAKAYRLLQRVDSLRDQFGRDDIDTAELRRSCQSWLQALTGRLSDVAGAQSAVDRATDAEEIKQIIRDRVLPELREAARQIGLRAAIQGGALVAISPSASLDGIFAGLRGLGVMREVAQICGFRPGLVVTIALLRRVAVTAATVTGTELLSRTLADAVLEKTPFLKHLAGALPGTSIAAIRLYRLACVTAEACSPVPETETP